MTDDTRTRINNRQVLYGIAENIVKHIEAMPELRQGGHANRLEVVAVVEDILIQSLHHQGYVRIEPIIEPSR